MYEVQQLNLILKISVALNATYALNINSFNKMIKG